MKNLRIYLFAITGLLFASCEDAIDITQPGELSPVDTFETVEDMQLGLNGIYSAVPGEGQILFTSIFTDEVALGRSNGGQGRDGSLAFNLTSLSGDASGIWADNYYAINLATRLIEAAEFVVVEEGSDEASAKANILAQAHAVRAFCHFQLLTYFSTDLTNDNALGVIAISSTPNITDKLPRNTNGEVFTLIDSDLAFAVENLSVDLSNAEAVANKVFFTQEAILAFKARMALYRGKFELANQLVDELDAAFNPNANNLSNNATYLGMWEDTYAQTNELIFALDRSLTGQTGNFAQFWSSVNTTVTGSPFFEVDRSLFNLVNVGTGTTADVRKFVITDPTALILEDYNDPAIDYAAYIEQDVLPVGKYSGNGQQNFLNDVKVFRFSEMVFIRAEYYANNNQLTEAIAQVNLVRRARHNNSTAYNLNPTDYNTATLVWGAIMDERRAELAFEGHRYIDVKRLGTKAGRGLSRDPRDCEFNGFCTLPANDYRFTLPIPQAELAANPNIVQNPQY